MPKSPWLLYAVAALALAIWWALSESMVAGGLFFAVVVVGALHYLATSSGSSARLSRDRSEGSVRKSFPRPPESPRGF